MNTKIKNILDGLIYLIILHLIFSGIISAKECDLDPFTPFTASNKFTQSGGYGLNEQGILYYDYGSRYNNLGKYSNPTFVAKYASVLFREIKNGDNKKKSVFFKQIDYLIKSSVKDTKEERYWSYPFENPYYHAPIGWYSAMTNGRILGLLAAAHSLSNDNKYLEFAELVLNKLAKPIEANGMSTYETNGGIWLEEVAAKGSPSHKVLNGHIFALAGVYNYYKYTDNPKAQKIFEGGVKAIKNNLDLYDAGFISYYSDKNYKGKKPYGPRLGYHVVHIMQLLWLYDITEDIDFLKKAMKFQAYEMNYGKITVSSSVNAETHGPDKMNLTFGNNYWSSAKFPVTVIFDMLDEKVLTGAGLLGHTVKSTPRSYLIEKSLDGVNYQGVARQNRNKDMRFINNFTHDVKARFLKFTIFSANSKGLALDGIAVIQKDPQYLVSNFCNYSISIKKITDKKLGTAIPIRCNGFIVIPPSIIKSDNLHIYGSIKSNNKEKVSINLFESDDLINWKLKSKSFYKDHMFQFSNIDKDKYLKLSFTTDISSISEIIFE